MTKYLEINKTQQQQQNRIKASDEGRQRQKKSTLNFE